MAAPAVITWDISADFARTGGGTYATALKSYILNPFTLTRGVDTNGGLPQAGTVSFVLDNRTGIFTRGNTTGALYGKLLPGVPIRVRFTTSAVTNFERWFGFIRTYTPSADFQTVTIQCTGMIESLGRQFPTVPTAASTARDSDGGAEAVLTSIGKTLAADGQFTDGVIALPYHWIDRTKSAAENMAAAARCEMATYPNVQEYWAGAGVPKTRFLAQNSALHLTPFDVGDDSSVVKPWYVHVQDRYEDRIGGVRVNYNSFQLGTAGDLIYQHPKGMLGISEVQKLTFGGTITGGTFTLTMNAYTSEAITWTATDATLVQRIQSAVKLLLEIQNPTATVQAVDTTLTSGIGDVELNFGGSLGNGVDVATITRTSSLTGTAPTLTVSDVTTAVFGKTSGPSDSILIPSKGTVVISGAYVTGLALSPTTPVATTDFRGNDAIDGTGTDRTSNLTVRTFSDWGTEFDCTLYNDYSAGVYLTLFKIRGTPVTKTPQSITFSAPLLDEPAAPVPTIDLQFVSDIAAIQKFAVSYLFPRRIMRPIYTWQIAGDTDDKQKAALYTQVTTQGGSSESLGALVNLKDTNAALLGSYVNDYVRVESEEITITPATKGANAPPVRGLYKGRPSWSYVNPGACIFDFFDRPDSTGLGTTPTGDVWTNLIGSFNVVSGAAVPAGLGEQGVSFNLGYANFAAHIRMENLQGDTNEIVGFQFRMADLNNRWLVIYYKTSNLIRLAKVVAGVYSYPASPAYTARGDGVMEMFSVAQGDRIRVNIDGQWIIDVADAAMNTNTKHGFFAQDTTEVKFDRVWMAAG